MGSGIALLDYDRDGDLDIFVVQEMTTAAAACFADYDRDG